MALAEQAELVAEMTLRDGFSAPASRMQKRLRSLDLDTKKLKDGLGKVGDGLRLGFKRSAVIGAGAIGLLAVGVRGGLESLAELEVLNKKTAQALETTGRAAEMSVDDIRKLADQYEELTKVDDKVIQNAENILLSFDRITTKGFEPALAAALDLSEGLGRDLNASIRLVGRALNDPIKGLASLERIGVAFTEQEREKIKALAESGRLMRAQDIILQKLNTRFGGQAAAAADSYKGSLSDLDDALEDVRMSLAGPLIRPLTRVSRKLAEFARSKDIQRGLAGIGEAMAELFKPSVSVNAEGGVKVMASAFDKGFAALKDGFTFLKDLPWDTIKSGAQGVFQVAAKAVDIFKGLPPDVQTALITVLAANKLTGGLVASGLGDIATFLLRSLTTINAANVTVVGANVTGPGVPGTPGAPGAPGSGGGWIERIVQAITRGAATGAGLTVATDIFRSQLSEMEKLKAYMAQTVGIEQSQKAEMIRLVLSGEKAENAVNRVRGTTEQSGRRVASAVSQDRQSTIDQGQKLRALTAEVHAKNAARLERQQASLIRLNAAEALSLTWFGRIRDATGMVAQEVRRKDLSVRVAVSTAVSMREVAGGYAKVASSRRFVAS